MGLTWSGMAADEVFRTKREEVEEEEGGAWWLGERWEGPGEELPTAAGGGEFMEDPTETDREDGLFSKMLQRGEGKKSSFYHKDTIIIPYGGF